VLAELTERERQLSQDYDWCLQDPAIQRTYAGQVVAVHQKKVWGAGKTHGEATQAALGQPGCPPREALAKVVIEGTVPVEAEN
jgi:hypothetical protein